MNAAEWNNMNYAVMTVHLLIRNYYPFLIEKHRGLDAIRGMAWQSLQGVETKKDVMKNANRLLHQEAKASGWTKPKGFPGYVSEETRLGIIGYDPPRSKFNKPNTEVPDYLTGNEAQKLLEFFFQHHGCAEKACTDVAILALASQIDCDAEIAEHLGLEEPLISERRSEIREILKTFTERNEVV